MNKNQKRIEATFLVNCSPQAAYDWLFERRIKDVYGYCESHDPTLEYLLLRRDNPLIDLAIARFGHSYKGIKTVFLRGNAGIRCAALSNPHMGYTRCNLSFRGYGSPIVECAVSKAEQESLAKNINLREDVIEDLLCRKGLFKDKSDEEYIRLLMWLGQNPRMKISYQDSGQRIDGYREYSHDRIFFMAWKLAETLPTTQHFAYALHTLLSGTTAVSATTFKDFPSVLERWRIEDDAKSGKPTYSESYFLRSRLADLIAPNDKLLKSDDFAERESFYRRFSPWNYEDWPSFIEKDGEAAFNGLVYNDALWANEKSRELLRDIAWSKIIDPHHNFNAINTYRAVEKNRRENHPNWFLEEDLRSSDSTEAIVRRLSEKLDEISEVTKSLNDTFADVDQEMSNNLLSFRKDIKEIERSNSSSADSVSTKLDNLFDRILKALDSNKPMPCAFRPAPLWPWFIIIMLLVLLLIK